MDLLAGILATALLLASPTALDVEARAASAARASRLVDDTDRSAFRSWFVLLADVQFEHTSADVVDCASLVRHAYREALRVHSPDWYRRNGVPVVAFADVRSATAATPGGWALFRVNRDPDRYAEFADAATIVRLNARRIGRRVEAARPGDLLYFHQPNAKSPDHVMVFVGESRCDSSSRQFLVYHTGPDEAGPGEVRKVALEDLRRHPMPRWRPVEENDAFVGVFRLAILDVGR
jgi:uncharacterized protein